MLKLVLHDGDEETWTEILGDVEFAHGELKRPVNSSSDETACRCYCMPISSNADLPNTPPDADVQRSPRVDKVDSGNAQPRVAQGIDRKIIADLAEIFMEVDPVTTH